VTRKILADAGLILLIGIDEKRGREAVQAN